MEKETSENGFRNAAFWKRGVISETLRFQNELAFENSVDRLLRKIRSFNKQNMYPRWRKTLWCLTHAKSKVALF